MERRRAVVTAAGRLFFLALVVNLLPWIDFVGRRSRSCCFHCLRRRQRDRRSRSRSGSNRSGAASRMTRFARCWDCGDLKVRSYARGCWWPRVWCSRPGTASLDSGRSRWCWADRTFPQVPHPRSLLAGRIRGSGAMTPNTMWASCSCPARPRSARRSSEVSSQPWEPRF
jgi:hypothetical protein